MKKIIVASQNPVKIETARIAFEQCFPKEKFEVEGVSVESGVPDQPIGDDQTLTGATNRSSNAMKRVSEADFFVGLEGGIEKRGDEMLAFAWAVVKSKEKTGKGRTASFFLPTKICELVNEGMELGDADDVVFGKSNSKLTNGAIGLLTNDLITRTSLYVPAVIMALLPFMREDLY